MSARWGDLARLAWRDSRSARSRLLLYMSAISLGVAALVAIDSYSSNVVRSIRSQSRELLGGDLSLSSRTAFAPAVDSLLDTLARGGITVGRTTTFTSMALVPHAPAPRLVQVNAVGPGVPFYGQIETDPAGRYADLQQGHTVLVDDALLLELGARVGDSLSLGAARFAIIGTLKNVPGDLSIASSLGPRVYIADKWVPETKLLVFGSRAEYDALLAVPAGTDPAAVVDRHRATLDAAHVRARTVQDTERSLTFDIQQLDRFLGVVALVALLLGGVGVASAIRAYIEEKRDPIAVLRVLGATSRQVLAVYLLETGALGFAGALAGAALGVIAQMALPKVAGGIVPVTVTPRLEPHAMLVGIGIGVWVAVIFALLPILGVRRISPLEAIRRDAAPTPVRRILSDWPRVVAALALAASVVLIAVGRAGTVRRGVSMSAGIGAALVLLSIAAAVVSRVTRRILKEHWPFVVRQGLANLYRPANQTRAVMLALGFGAFLMSTLYLVQWNLIARLTASTLETRANLAFFDVQSDQARSVDSLIRAAHAPVLQKVPIVPMRIAAINGHSTSDAQTDARRASWALRREYRSSYRDTLIASEKLVAGRWVGREGSRHGAPWPISVESSVATELGVALGDTITWDVQGVKVPSIVTSLRDVTWARFEPNFFVIFAPGALDQAPQTLVFLSRVTDPAARAALQRAVVEHDPNVSTIDLGLIQQALDSILDKVSVAIRFMALFSVATGVLVLLSAVAAARRQRLREGVLLKTLGATRAQIARIMLSEYTVLGLLSAATGLVLSLGGAWALMHFLFDSPFSPAAAPLGVLALIIVALTAAVGLSSSRDVFAETPMAALREQ
ncbi:MAG TPA: FtsX-like permease family protein [Gemmatimonadaceae bacterium]|nr:FtsX-like permease family protein [Gemmatimonadaceae bacterium]